MIKRKNIFKLCLTALLCVIAVVMNRFLGINMQNLSLSLSFIPIMACAMLLGPLYGGVCGALADLIGALLFPFGPFFPGFTLTAFISGFILGFVPKSNNNKSFFAICFPIIFLEEISCTILLNSLWISVLYDSPFLPLVLVRLPKSAILFITKPLIAFFIKRHILPPINKML